MSAIRIRTKITQNHELILRDLLLAEGKKVEVIILEDDSDNVVNLSITEHFPLRGKAIRFDSPFDSSTNETDWEATQ
ncbi:hypothetical protein [Spirosoma koreense]